MTTVKYGLVLAYRRWALALVAILGILVPIAGGTFAAIVDYSSRASDEQLIADRLGTSQAILTPDNGLGSVADRQHVAEGLEETLQGAPVQQVLTAFDVPVKFDGITKATPMMERDWSGTYAGLMKIGQGQQPQRPGEAVVTPALARVNNLVVGSSLSIESATTIKIVGIGVLPLTAGDSQVVFTAPGTLSNVDLTVVRAEWTLASIPSTSEIARLNVDGILVRDRATVGNGPDSFYTREPITFGGCALVALLSLLFAIRYLAGRTRSRTRAVLDALGATRRFAACIVLVESATCALLGVIFTVVAVLTIGPITSRRAAAAVNHLPPDLLTIAPKFILAIAVAVACVIATSMAELMPHRPAKLNRSRARTTRVRSRRLSNARLGGRSLGWILAKAYLRRTVVLSLMSFLLTASVTVVYSVVTSVNAAANASAEPLWRATDITLALDGVEPPAYLVTELSDLVSGEAAVLSRVREPKDLTGLASVGIAATRSVKSWCRLATTDSPTEWKMLTGSSLPVVAEQAFGAGQAVILNPACSSDVVTVQTAPGEGEVATFGSLHAVTAGPSDRFTLRIAEAVVSNATVARLHLVTVPVLLIARGGAALSQDVRDSAARLVENAGFPATALRQGVVAPVGTPPTLIVLIVGLFVVLIVGGCTGVIATFMDDERTHHILDSVGMSPWQRMVVLLTTCCGPIMSSAALGLLVGLIGATWWCLDKSIVLSAPMQVLLAGFMSLFVCQVATTALALRAPAQ